MIILIRTEREQENGERFKDHKILEHCPIKFDRHVGGWQGEGGGLSTEDLENIFSYIKDTARNIHSFTVELVW